MILILFLDINECTTGDYNCRNNSHCSNTIGNYTCPCKNGYNATDDHSTCQGT